MVDALPAALIAVGATGTMGALGVAGDVMKTVRLQEAEDGTVGIVVEVASHQHLGMRGQLSDGRHQTVGHQLAVGTGLPLTAIAAGGMYHKDVQRVGHGLSPDIQDVTGGPHAV